MGIFTGHLNVEAVCLDSNLCTPIRLHGPITCNTVILNLIFCIVSGFIATQLHVSGSKCMLLLCILYFM
jgi:hypothetical protein